MWSVAALMHAIVIHVCAQATQEQLLNIAKLEPTKLHKQLAALKLNMIELRSERDSSVNERDQLRYVCRQ
jgi:hypothetical protein